MLRIVLVVPVVDVAGAVAWRRGSDGEMLGGGEFALRLRVLLLARDKQASSGRLRGPRALLRARHGTRVTVRWAESDHGI
jgi:hypothetical protein